MSRFLTFVIFALLTSTVQASEVQICVDSKAVSQCLPAPITKAAIAAKDSGSMLAADDRLHRCLVCCDQRLNACGGSGNCIVPYQNCVANCNSSGETPADWRCW